jgi:hypothetical protein
LSKRLFFDHNVTVYVFGYYYQFTEYINPARARSNPQRKKLINMRAHVCDVHGYLSINIIDGFGPLS